MKTEVVETINSMFAKRVHSLYKAGPGELEREIPNIKPIYCADGASLSVQASRFHYCFPRNNEGPYAQVEVGFPSVKPPESWREYCQGDFDAAPCDTVYGNVPLTLVAEFIEQHGGIRAEAAPKLVLPEPSAPVKRSVLQQRRWNVTLEDMGLAP